MSFNLVLLYSFVYLEDFLGRWAICNNQLFVFKLIDLCRQCNFIGKTFKNHNFQRADIVSDPNFSEFCNWLDHHKWRRTTVSGAMAGMAAGAGMGGAKVITLSLNSKILVHLCFFLLNILNIFYKLNLYSRYRKISN